MQPWISVLFVSSLSGMPFPNSSVRKLPLFLQDLVQMHLPIGCLSWPPQTPILAQAGMRSEVLSLGCECLRFSWCAKKGSSRVCQLLGSPFSNWRKEWLKVGYGMHVTTAPIWVQCSLTYVKASLPAFTQSQTTATWTLSLKAVRPAARGLRLIGLARPRARQDWADYPGFTYFILLGEVSSFFRASFHWVMLANANLTLDSQENSPSKHSTSFLTRREK